MKKVSLLKTSFLALVLMPAVAAAADRVGDFSLLDQDGYHHGMHYWSKLMIVMQRQFPHLTH